MTRPSAAPSGTRGRRGRARRPRVTRPSATLELGANPNHVRSGRRSTIMPVDPGPTEDERDQEAVPADWYPDPDDGTGNLLRYWTGDSWTEDVQQATEEEKRELTWPSASNESVIFQTLHGA